MKILFSHKPKPNYLQPFVSPTVSSTKCSSYITEICHFQQKLNHKLTEINYDLKKFQFLNERPKYNPPVLKCEVEDYLSDIETLKVNSDRLLCKLEKLKDEECSDSLIKIESGSNSICQDALRESNVNVSTIDSDINVEDIKREYIIFRFQLVISPQLAEMKKMKRIFKTKTKKSHLVY